MEISGKGGWAGPRTGLGVVEKRKICFCRKNKLVFRPHSHVFHRLSYHSSQWDGKQVKIQCAESGFKSVDLASKYLKLITLWNPQLNVFRNSVLTAKKRMCPHYESNWSMLPAELF
jgi:hypothetical protein